MPADRALADPLTFELYLWFRGPRRLPHRVLTANPGTLAVQARTAARSIWQNWQQNCPVFIVQREADEHGAIVTLFPCRL